MRSLEVALAGQVIDQVVVQRLGAAVGEIEGRMTWAQATAMLNVRDALSEDQLIELLEMRAKYTTSTTEALSDAPVDLGRQLFAQCVLCHSPSRDTAVAPSLAGILGRAIAADPGFDLYSPALKSFANSQDAWSPELLDSFLRSPRSVVPGTTMSFDGLDTAHDRVAILAYIGTLD